MREPLKLVLFKTANIDFGFSFVASGVALGFSVALGVGPGVSWFTAGDFVGSTVGPVVGMADALGCGVGESFLVKRSSPLRVNSQATRTPATASTTTIPKTHGKALFRVDSGSESPAR
jgi:hypothetical protein